MKNLSTIGRIFFGIAIAGMGINAVCCHVLPYILMLPANINPAWLLIPAVTWGVIFVVAGASMIFNKWTRPVSLLFGTFLLLVFLFYYIPYQLLCSPNYMHFTDWENAEKELALAGGALVVAGCYAAGNENKLFTFLSKLIPFGAILFAIPVLSFGILHFMYGPAVAGMVPVWIPWHLFWIYFCGAALIGSGVSIIFKIKTEVIATLLGIMIFTWFVILHLPLVFGAAPSDLSDEITSAFLALAYSGTALVIAGGNVSYLRHEKNATDI